MLIVYHSQSGSCLQLAEAARCGALSAGETAALYRACDVGSCEVIASRGLLLVAAENSGRLSGATKDFLDRCFYPLIAHNTQLPYALLCSAGNDGRGAIAEAQRILRGIPFTQALEPLIVRGEPDEPGLERAREMGEGFAVGLSMGIF
ncbi:MAG: hypothetical protein Cons2KO_17210 [Congregibacter sp.]